MFLLLLCFSLQSSFRLIRNTVSRHRILRVAQTIVCDSLLHTSKWREQFNQSFAAIDQLRHLRFVSIIAHEILLLRSWQSGISHDLRCEGYARRQCKLTEPLLWARYFHEYLQRIYYFTCSSKRSTRQVFPARKRVQVCLFTDEIRRELLSMGLFKYTNSRLRVRTFSLEIKN